MRPSTGRDVNAVRRFKEATMLKSHRFVLTLIVVSASFVPAANAFAGVTLNNHNETLLLDL
jgi:hypothetical protein